MKKLLMLMVFAISISFANGQVNLTNGLLLYYPFSGNTGDSSGNGVNGTLHGSPTLTNNRFNQANKAYSFNGTTDYITAAATTLEPTSYTYSAWASAADNSGIAAVLSIGGNNIDQNLLLSFTDGWIGGGYDVANVFIVSQGSLPTLNTWYHLVVTRDNSNIKLYINNALAGSTPTSGQSNLYGTPAGAFFGKRSAPNDQFFNGSIDDIRIYNRVLTTQEIAALFNETPVNISGISSKNLIPSFNISPNPNNGNFEINYSAPLSDYTIYIQNPLGEIIFMETHNTPVPKSSINLNIENPGVYFLTITSDKGIETNKIIIQ